MRKTNGKKRRGKPSSPVPARPSTNDSKRKRFPALLNTLFSSDDSLKKKGRKEEIEKTFLYVSYVRVSRVSGKHSFFFPFQPEGKFYDRA